jgi:hypothetical protein
MTEPPPRVSDARRDLAPSIDGVIARAMAKSKTDRYSTCAEMMSAAADALRGTPGHAVPPPPMPNVGSPLSPMPQASLPPPPVTPSPTPTPLPPNPLSPTPSPGGPVVPQPSYPPPAGSPQYPPPQYGPIVSPPGPYGPETAPEPVAKRARTAHVCGVVGVCLGIFFIGLPLAIIALVQGKSARAELDRLGTAPTLRAKANRAITLGWVGIGLTAFSLVAQIINAAKG